MLLLLLSLSMLLLLLFLLLLSMLLFLLLLLLLFLLLSMLLFLLLLLLLLLLLSMLLFLLLLLLLFLLLLLLFLMLWSLLRVSHMLTSKTLALCESYLYWRKLRVYLWQTFVAFIFGFLVYIFVAHCFKMQTKCWLVYNRWSFNVHQCQSDICSYTILVRLSLSMINLIVNYGRLTVFHTIKETSKSVDIFGNGHFDHTKAMD